MESINIKLRNARVYLGLTQEDVAKLMNINRTSIINIENGTRKVKEEELVKFSKIYGWSMEELTEKESVNNMVEKFSREFNELSNKDQHEILNLIKFKKMYKENNNKV